MKTEHADTPSAIEESPRAHYDTVGKAILTMGVIGSLVGTGLILFKDSHAGYIDGPSALGISAVMVILALWMIGHART